LERQGRPAFFLFVPYHLKGIFNLDFFYLIMLFTLFIIANLVYKK
jgi:hypothetical protein